MKKSLLAGLSVLSIFLLSSCGSSSNSSANANSKTQKSETSKTSKPNTKQVSGKLTKVGTYSVRNGVKATLVKIFHPSQKLTFQEDQKSVDVGFDDIKIIKNDIQDSSIKKDLEDTYKTSISGNKFYTVQIDFNLTNKAGNDAYLEGLSTLTIGDRSLSDGQFYDPTPGVTVSNNATYSNSIVAVVDKNETNFSRLGIAFENIDEPGQSNMLMQPTSSQYLNLN
ncbi:MAG: hypothetical protein ABF967_11235 [Lacticaseibacillus paracasei]